MNDLTKVGLAIGVAVLLVLGMAFRNEPGSYGSGVRSALQESKSAVSTLTADLEARDGTVSALRAELEQNTQSVTELRASLAQSEETVTALRADLEQNKQVAATLRSELEEAGSRSEALSLKLRESGQQRTELGEKLGVLTEELDALRQPQQQYAQSAQDTQTRIATLELEAQGLREKLATSEASSQEIIAGLNARLRASTTPLTSADNEGLLNNIQALKAQINQADAQASQRDEKAKQAEAELREQLSALSDERAELQARLAADSDNLAAQQDAMATLEEQGTSLKGELDTTAAELERVVAERDSLQDKLAAMEKTSNESQGARAALAGDLQQLEADKQALTEQARSLTEQTQVLSAARDELQVQLDGTTAQLDEARGEIGSLSADRDRLYRALGTARQESSTRTDSAPADNTGDDLIAALNNQFAVAGIDGVEVYPRSGGVVSVRAGNNEIFSPGSTNLSSVGREVLAEVGKVISAMPDSRLQIEGHTDNIPIGPVMKGLYGSNWDLSVARAMAAVRHLERRVGIGANRLSGAGFGEFMPVATNDTVEGRSQNRRIEIVVYPIEQTPN